MGEKIARITTSSLVAKGWSLLRAGPYSQGLVVEAAASLAAARAMLAVQPFSRVAKQLGTFSAPDGLPVASAAGRSLGAARLARKIGWAVRATAPWMPFRAVCLEQAIAARAMLRRRGIESVLHLGAGPDGSRMLSAHAWLEAAGIRVTGYPVASHLTEVGRFS
jgi:hypothetical protein